jgi:hypothetical protein
MLPLYQNSLISQVSTSKVFRIQNENKRNVTRIIVVMYLLEHVEIVNPETPLYCATLLRDDRSSKEMNFFEL